MLRKSTQLVLPFIRTDSFSRDNFLSAASNCQALGWIERWPRWRAPLLTLYGPKGCGKSHLAAIWQQQSNAALIDGRDLDQLESLAPALIIDHADWIGGDSETERKVLYGLNRLRSYGGFGLLLAQSPPPCWSIELGDLRSRLRASLAVQIEPPDQDLLAAVLIKQILDRQLRIEPDVATYLIEHMERSFESVRRLVAALDQETLRDKRPLTRFVARQILKEVQSSGQ